MNSVPSDHAALPFVAPCRPLNLTAPLTWLRLGWDDLVAAIVIAVLAGFATMFVGFIAVLPLIGHATWHAYRQTIDAAAWPQRNPPA